MEPAGSVDTSDGSSLPEPGTDDQNEQKPGGFFKRFGRSLAALTGRRDSSKDQGEKQAKPKQPDEVLRLMFAYSPLAQPIYDADQQPHCPTGLIPVCFIRLVEEIRPDTQKAVETFKDAGVSIKILEDGEPTRALAIAQELGLVKAEALDAPVATGDEISQWTPDQLKQAVRKKTIFALLTTDQMIQVVNALQDQGEYVAVMGGSIPDLPILSEANVSIARQGSSPKVLDQANIILLKNSPNALPEVLQKGQRIVSGMLEVLKLNFTQIVYILLLLVAMVALGKRILFYNPTQGGAIGIFTIVIPAIALSVWSSTVPTKMTSMHKQLVHFIIPAAAMTAVCVVVVNTFFLRASASTTYNQLVVTHFLVVIGLLLVIFVQPPLRILAFDDTFSGDWRPTYIAGALFLAFQIATHIHLAQTYLKIAPLATMEDYLFVGGMALVWAVMTMSLWRLHWVKTALDWSASWLATSKK